MTVPMGRNWRGPAPFARRLGPAVALEKGFAPLQPSPHQRLKGLSDDPGTSAGALEGLRPSKPPDQGSALDPPKAERPLETSIWRRAPMAEWMPKPALAHHWCYEGLGVLLCPAPTDCGPGAPSPWRGGSEGRRPSDLPSWQQASDRPERSPSPSPFPPRSVRGPARQTRTVLRLRAPAGDRP